MELHRRIILVSGLVGLLGLATHAWSQSTKPSPVKSHRHAGAGESVGADIPEFSMVETSLRGRHEKGNLTTSRNRKYEAFTVSGTRLLWLTRNGKILVVVCLWVASVSDLSWADYQTLVFDRWSQPHYGVHYAVNVKSRKLLVVAPFRDKS
jgi:hypothetical protein